jgi:F0F1-type ATP synthase membrane subunit b/b'
LITQTRKDIATNHEDESTRRKELDVDSKQTLQTEKLQAQKERQESDLEAKQERQNKDLAAKQERLDKDLEAKEARLKLDLAAKETRLKEDLEARLERERFRGATSKEIEAMKDETKKAVEGMRDTTLKDIQASKESAAKQIQSSKETAEQDLEKMKEKGRKDLERMKEDFKKSLPTKPTKEADPSVKDFKGWSAYTKERDAIVKSTKKEEDALTDQIVKAEAKVFKAKDASWYDIGAPDLTKSSAAYDELVNKRDVLRRERATKELNLVLSMPEFASKEKIVTDLQKQLKVLPAETDAPKKDAPKDAKDVSAAKLAATSNKPDVELQGKVEASGQKYEPSKYNYRVAPDGSIQRKAK